MRILVLDLHIAKYPSAALKIFNTVKPHCHGNLELIRFYSRAFNFQILFNYEGIILSGLDNSRLLYSGKMQQLKSCLSDLENNIQVLGICGGHQVLATTYDYPIHEVIPEVGWHNVRITQLGKNDPLFHDMEEVICPFHHHNKAVFQVSAEKILAENERCIQAVLYRPGVRGVQFHPEYTFPNEDVLQDKRYNHQLFERNSLWNRSQEQFFRNFVSLCERSVLIS
jgi:GMP synthase-like glutamine amidotransferase